MIPEDNIQDSVKNIPNNPDNYLNSIFDGRVGRVVAQPFLDAMRKETEHLVVKDGLALLHAIQTVATYKAKRIDLTDKITVYRAGNIVRIDIKL